MKLVLKRIAFKKAYTIGKLFIDGKYFCDTLEDADRGLYKDMPLLDIRARKIPGETCIPYGTYDITLDVVSMKYSNYSKYPYARSCGAKMPRLLRVPGYEGILIHAGNNSQHTDGCILVGENKVVGQVINSQATWKKLYSKLLEKKKEGIIIEITKQ